MTLPSNLKTKTEWVLVGPMGPILEPKYLEYPTMAVDGGAHFIQKSDVWVGDSDSFSGEVVATHVFHYPPEKDRSDLHLALSLLDPRRSQKLHLWGFLGGRQDHELFNLGEAHGFLESASKCELIFYDSTGRVVFWFLGAGFWKFSFHGAFSLGTLKTTSLSLEGRCKYQIRNSTPFNPLSSLGLSNQGSGEMMLTTEAPVFLYFPEKA